MIRDSQEIQRYDQDISDGDCQASGNSFSGKQATGSSGNGASGAGATSKPAGQTRIVTGKSSAASHPLPPATSEHKEGEKEGNGDRPPVKKAQQSLVLLSPVAGAKKRSMNKKRCVLSGEARQSQWSVMPVYTLPRKLFYRGARVTRKRQERESDLLRLNLRQKFLEAQVKGRVKS